MQAGEPFLGKLHHPERAICGIGWFEGLTRLPVVFAWKSFGPGNGAANYEESLKHLSSLRHGQPILAFRGPGCILLRSLVVFPKESWIAGPSGWEPNIGQGKTCDADHGAGRELWAQVLERLSSPALSAGEYRNEEQVQFMEGLSHHRLGQGAFHALVTNSYQRRCTFTREQVIPTLEACHIRPAASGGRLLRSDVHSLFDRGYLWLHPRTLQLQASPRLELEFQNLVECCALQGQVRLMPAAVADRQS